MIRMESGEKFNVNLISFMTEYDQKNRISETISRAPYGVKYSKPLSKAVNGTRCIAKLFFAGIIMLCI